MISQMSSRHCRVRMSMSIVREALVTSVPCTPPLMPPVRFHRTQVSVVSEEQVAGLGALASALRRCQGST